MTTVDAGVAMAALVDDAEDGDPARARLRGRTLTGLRCRIDLVGAPGGAG
ncbi:hypothetical protein ACI79C_18590 [Geodermatophilus sp. SYSU D00697]